MKFVSKNEVNYSVNQSKQIRINSLKNTLHKNVDVRGYFNENEAFDTTKSSDNDHTLGAGLNPNQSLRKVSKLPQL